MKHQELIDSLLAVEKEIRSDKAATYEEIKAAQSASQAAASLKEALNKLTPAAPVAPAAEPAPTP